MVAQFIESEKIWRSQKLSINFTSLGQAILEKLKECYSQNPNRILEVYHQSGLEVTVKDVLHQTICVAQNLLRIGVKKGDIVLIYSKCNPKITPIAFACYTIGAVVNFFDINYVEDTRNFIFDLVDPAVIIYEDEFKELVLKAIEFASLSKVKHVLSLDSTSPSVDELLFKPKNDGQSFQAPDLGDPLTLPAVLALTSGSTGMPKLAIHTHGMLLQSLFHKGWFSLSPGDVICIFYDDLRWICQIELMLQTVFFGVRRIYNFARKMNITRDLEAEIIQKHGITHLSVVPIVFLEMLDYSEKLGNSLHLKSLKSVLLVGETISDGLVPFAKKIIPNCKIIKCYGLTELPGMVANDEFVNIPNSKGMEIKDGFSVKIVDRNDNPLGPNEKGRLLFKSDVPLLGYFKNESANKCTLLEDGWFDTQDYAFVDEYNLLHIVTRAKFLLQGAEGTIVPSDVENIVNEHENVLMSALVGHPNPDKSDHEIGTIFVVLKSTGESNQIKYELCKLLKKRLTKDQLEFVKFLRIVPKLPRTSCSKTNRKALGSKATLELSTEYSIV